MAVNLNPTSITDLRDTCRQYRGNLGAINVSGMRDFSDLFNVSEFQSWNNNDFNGIENWDLSGSQYFDRMFKGCVNFNRNITIKNKVSGFSYPIGCESMFEGCTSLTTVTAKINANVQGPTNNLYRMFYGCTRLTSISGSIYISTQGGINNCESMFEGCTSLRSITKSILNIDNSGGFTNCSRMFYGCTSLTEYTSYEVYYNTIDYMFYGCTNLTTVNLRFSSSTRSISASYMFYGCSNLNNLTLYNIANLNINDASYMFYGCSRLNSDLSNLNLIITTTCESMFEGCTSYNQPLGSLVIASCINYDRMFKDCRAYDQDLSSWKLKGSSTYVDMFTNCPIQTVHKPYPLNGNQLFKPSTREELKQYCDDLGNDLSSVDTSLITDMSYIFENSTRQESDIFKILGWDFSNVTSIRGLFKGCSNLKFYYNRVFYLEYLDLTNVEDASELFMNCTANTFYFGRYDVNLLPKLKNASSMYENNINNYCYSYHFKTENLEIMDNMFKNSKFDGYVFNTSTYRGTYKSWNLPNLISMNGAFSNCSNYKSYNPLYFDASNVSIMNNVFDNTPLTAPVWWYTVNIPSNLEADINQEYELDISSWLDPYYSSYTFRLETSEPDVTIKTKSRNVFLISFGSSGNKKFNLTYNTYGKKGFSINAMNLDVNLTIETKTKTLHELDFTTLYPFTVNIVEFSNIQQGLTLVGRSDTDYAMTTSFEGTFTADVLVNRNISGVLTVISTKLIQDFTIDTKNSIVTEKDFNTEYPGYNVTPMTVVSNDADLSVNKLRDGVFEFKPLNEGTFTATITLNTITSTVTVNSASGITDLNYTYKATEKKNVNLIDDFGSDINYDDLSITSNNPEFLCNKLNPNTYDLIGLVSGSFTADIALNNEVKTISFTSTKLLQNEVRDINSNSLFSFNFNELFPNSLFNSTNITCANPDLSITKNPINNYSIIANNIGIFNCIIDINGEESNLTLNVNKLISDQIIYVYNKQYKLNFNTAFPGIDSTSMTLTPTNKLDKIQIIKSSNGVFELTFFEKGSYDVTIKIGKVESNYTFKVFFVDVTLPDIYQYPDSFINELIKTQLFDPNLFIYQYNQYGKIEWISKYFDYMNTKMKKYLDYIYLWYALKTNQDLSDLNIEFINDNESYFYFNFIEKYFDGIYKAFGSSSTSIFWDGNYKWNEQGVLWDTSINISNLKINKFKAFIRFIKDINYNSFNIVRFIQFCNEFANADSEEADKVELFVDETSFTDPSSIIVYSTKLNDNTSILDSIIRSVYKNLLPMNEFLIRQKNLP